jgi:hypothetical protein
MLNMSLNKKVVIETHEQPWVASLHTGIWRKPLAKENAEKVRRCSYFEC